MIKLTIVHPNDQMCNNKTTEPTDDYMCYKQQSNYNRAKTLANLIKRPQKTETKANEIHSDLSLLYTQFNKAYLLNIRTLKCHVFPFHYCIPHARQRKYHLKSLQSRKLHFHKLTLFGLGVQSSIVPLP